MSMSWIDCSGALLLPGYYAGWHAPSLLITTGPAAAGPLTGDPLIASLRSALKADSSFNSSSHCSAVYLQSHRHTATQMMQLAQRMCQTNPTTTARVTEVHELQHNTAPHTPQLCICRHAAAHIKPLINACATKQRMAHNPLVNYVTAQSMH